MGLRMLTAGESHGPALTVIIDGLPSGLPLTADDVVPHLRARQQGYGRGGRQKIEHDAIEFLGGVRHGETIGAPVAMLMRNRDFANWSDVMAAEPTPQDAETKHGIFQPRPGHADLAGGLKHNLHDMRNVLERASARETAIRVAAGSVARALLSHFKITLQSHVVQIGEVRCANTPEPLSQAWRDAVADSPVRCADAAATQAMMQAIDVARHGKESLGGTFEVVATGVPPGLGTYAQWDKRLDGRIAQALTSIPGVKGVEFGLGFAMAALPGSQVHDPIQWSESARFTRTTNHAGGVEGGMSNGEPIVLRAVMKPLATVMDPLPSVDVRTKTPARAHIERADTCVVPAAALIAEAMLAWTLAEAMREKFGGDSLTEMQRNHVGYMRQLQEY